MNDIRKYFTLIPNEKKEQTHNLETNSITIFTDGSSLNNGQKNKYQSGGIGIYIEDTKECISEKLIGKITNNIAELKACIKGIQVIMNRENYNNEVIKIYSDSEYVINSMTKWATTWKKNDWKKYDKKKGKVEIKNKDLIIELYTLYNKYPITFIHTKAHGAKPSMQNTKEYKIWYGNYMADKLAVEASNSH
jgi:ribonuclease HI